MRKKNRGGREERLYVRLWLSGSISVYLSQNVGAVTNFGIFKFGFPGPNLSLLHLYQYSENSKTWVINVIY